jgi:hypothetical protein
MMHAMLNALETKRDANEISLAASQTCCQQLQIIFSNSRIGGLSYGWRLTGWAGYCRGGEDITKSIVILNRLRLDEQADCGSHVWKGET